MAVNINIEKCVGCTICVSSCPFDALEMVDDKAVANDACTLCGICVDSCEYEAIALPERESASTDNIDDYRGVWVYVQSDADGVHHVSLELIGEGRKLADELGTDLSCMFFGENVQSIIDELSIYEINRLYTVEHTVLNTYRTAPYVECAASLIRTHKPEIVLIGATSNGRDFAGGLATELAAGLTADCTNLGIEIETRSLLQTRPAFGGNIMATIKSSNRRPQMATVRPKVFALPEKGDKKSLDIVKGDCDLSEENQKTKVLEWIPVEEKVNLADANIIVAGGRGMGSMENTALLTELAGMLDGAMGASRGIVDAGWVDYSHQVGQTGRTVRPNVYIACGISGAVQHLAGMKTSDVIFAINKDADAPIFAAANYGFVGDVLEILPKVNEKLKKRLSK